MDRLYLPAIASLENLVELDLEYINYWFRPAPLNINALRQLTGRQRLSIYGFEVGARYLMDVLAQNLSLETLKVEFGRLEGQSTATFDSLAAMTISHPSLTFVRFNFYGNDDDLRIIFSADVDQISVAGAIAAGL